DGIDTDEAIKRVLSTDMDALQASFDGFLGERFGKLRKALDTPESFSRDLPIDKLKAAAAQYPGSFGVQMSLGRALRATDPQGAIQAFEKAIALVPMMTGPESPYMQIVEISLAANDKALAAQALGAMTAHDNNGGREGRSI